MVANALLQNHAQNVYLMLVLATVLGTLAGAWFAANAQTAAVVWLFLVMSASCGISSVMALAILPMVDGLHPLMLPDVVLVLVGMFGAVRTWVAALDQVGISS